MPSPIAIDFETFYSKKLKYSVKTMIAEQYCRHPLFDAYIIAASDGTSCWSGHPRDFNWEILNGRVVLAHNWYFDYNVWLELARRGLAPQPNFSEAHCTANMCAYLCNRRALDAAVEHLLGVKVSKDARAEADGKHWPKDFSVQEQADMLEYARRDPHYSWVLWDRFSDQWPAHERLLSNFIIAQGMRGVQINRELLDSYILQTHDMKIATENAIPWIANSEDDEWAEFTTKPTSTKCIAEQCRLSGIPCPPVKSHDEEGYEEWETKYLDKHAWIGALSAWRSINKLYKTFITVKERLRSDGTMPFGQKYCGTHTGRISGESRVNLFNQRKQAVLCRAADGLMETNDKKVDDAHKHKSKNGAWPEWVRHAIDFRNLITPRPGYKMITADLAQIEPRVSAWLAGDFVFLDEVKKGVSPYQAHAVLTMGWTGGELKYEDPKLYALAKARLLSLGYGAGWEKLIVMAQRNAGIDLTENDPEFVTVVHPITGESKQVSGYGLNAKKVVADYRASNPKIKGMWESLDDALHRSIGADLVIKLPSGRNLRYEKVKAETRIEPDTETGKPRRRTVWTVGIGGKRVITYGSKIFENIVQAASRDVHYYGVLRLEAAGLPSLFGVYDEAVLEVSPHRTVDEVIACMVITPEWLPGCPLDVEANEVPCYTK